LPSRNGKNWREVPWDRTCLLDFGPVDTKPFPGEKMSHHPLEFREAIVDLPNSDLTSERKNALVRLRREGKKLLKSSIHMYSILRV
jgi:hypothetical protein